MALHPEHRGASRSGAEGQRGAPPAPPLRYAPGTIVSLRERGAPVYLSQRERVGPSRPPGRTPGRCGGPGLSARPWRSVETERGEGEFYTLALPLPSTGGGRACRPSLARPPNCLKHRWKVHLHQASVESNDRVSVILQPPRSRRVVDGLIRLGVRVAIDLDRQLRLGTVEVQYEATDRLLAADLEADLLAPYCIPYLRLGRCQRMTQIARTLENGRKDEVALRFRHAVPLVELALTPSPLPPGEGDQSWPSPGGRG